MWGGFWFFYIFAPMNNEPGQDVWDAFWAQKADTTKVYPSSPSVLQTIEEKFDLKGLKVLEVGAGTGRDSCELARKGAEVYVLDFSPNSLSIIDHLRQEHGLDNLHLVRGDAFAAPFADNSFDLVFHQGLLEHFNNPLDLLRENYRLLKPGAACLCDIPQTFHLYTIVKKILIAMDKWFAGWETQYTMGQLETMMQDAGFVPEYAYGDWMRPNFFYRVLREVLLKLGMEIPKYPLDGTWYQKTKDEILDRLSSWRPAHYTQLSIGVIGRKPDTE
jgi:SAM-dependent methyltransferase